MSKKRIVAMILATALVMAIVAGCEFTLFSRDREHQPHIHIPVPTGDMPEDPDELAALRDEYGLDENFQVTFPEGVTEGPTEPELPALTTMPRGEQAQASEVYPMLREAIDIFNSGRFFMQGRSTTPPNEFAPTAANNTPMTLAVDGNRMMSEITMDWNLMLQDTDGGAFGAPRVRAATLNTMFGRRMRVVMRPDGIMMAFPDRNLFFDMQDLGEATDTDLGGADDMSGLDEFLGGFGSTREIPRDIPAERVTVGGREYLSATITEDGMRFTYFFHNGELRRLEATHTEEGVSIIMEVQEFHGDPDARLFTSQGMGRVPLAQLVTMMNLLGGGLF